MTAMGAHSLTPWYLLTVSSRLRTVRLSTVVATVFVMWGLPRHAWERFGIWLAISAAQDRAGRTLDVYVVDVEGGNATLFVSPSRESVLIDTGNGGPAAMRDADRIMAAVKDAGLTQLDHLITTARGASGVTPPPVHNGQAYWIKVSARQDGSFTVTNARNRFAKTYAAR